MSEGNELQRLETFVEKLLEDFRVIRKELAEKDAMIAELNDQVAMQQLEREEISDRVTRIVSQFESWERDLAGVEREESTSASETSYQNG